MTLTPTSSKGQLYFRKLSVCNESITNLVQSLSFGHHIWWGEGDIGKKEKTGRSVLNLVQGRELCSRRTCEITWIEKEY